MCCSGASCKSIVLSLPRLSCTSGDVEGPTRRARGRRIFERMCTVDRVEFVSRDDIAGTTITVPVDVTVVLLRFSVISGFEVLSRF